MKNSKRFKLIKRYQRSDEKNNKKFENIDDFKTKILFSFLYCMTKFKRLKLIRQILRSESENINFLIDVSKTIEIPRNF